MPLSDIKQLVTDAGASLKEHTWVSWYSLGSVQSIKDG